MRIVKRVGTDLEYAAAQEFGATIMPKRAKVLHFFAADGTEVFTKGPVKIPAHPYLRPAFDNNRHAAVAEVGRVLGQALRRSR